MDLFEILRNVLWRPAIGDPSFAGWLTVFAYFLTAFLGLSYRQRLAAAGRPRREHLIWLLVSVTLIFLGFNKQLDLQSLLTAVGREIAKTQGWYGGRRAVQLLFIGGLAAAGGLSLISLAWLWRKAIRQHAVIFAGLAALLLFVLMRAVSFHTIDGVIQERVLGVRLNTILELGSLLLIAWGLWQVVPPNQKAAQSGPRRPAPLLIIVTAVAASAAVFQLLSGSLFNWQSDFSEVAPPFEHPMTTVSSAPATSFIESFDTFPEKPTPFISSSWDITVHTRDWTTWETLDPLDAVYGPDCAPPPASHVADTFEDAVFICDGRLVSAINGSDYAATVLTPAYMVKFSEQPATILFDMSTGRASGRDWVEIWISPFDEQLQLPGQDWMPDMNGHPNNGIQLFLDLATWRFSGRRISGGEVTELNGDWFTLDEISDQSYTDLTQFELTIDPHGITFGLPIVGRWWVDDTWQDPLSFEYGVVQITHHSFEPLKDCGADCGPNSWVFDNVSMAPAVPFTIIQAQQRYVNRGTGPAVDLAGPTPVGSYLRFVAFSDEVQVSFDDGETWQAAARQRYKRDELGYQSYWTPMPAGVDNVHFRARDVAGNDWQIRDISAWSLFTNQ